MKIILIGFIMFLNASLIIAQNEPDNSIRRPTNIIYLNLLGAVLVSIDYEKLIPLNKKLILSNRFYTNLFFPKEAIILFPIGLSFGLTI